MFKGRTGERLTNVVLDAKDRERLNDKSFETAAGELNKQQRYAEAELVGSFDAARKQILGSLRKSTTLLGSSLVADVGSVFWDFGKEVVATPMEAVRTIEFFWESRKLGNQLVNACEKARDQGVISNEEYDKFRKTLKPSLPKQFGDFVWNKLWALVSIPVPGVGPLTIGEYNRHAKIEKYNEIAKKIENRLKTLVETSQPKDIVKK